MLQRRKKRLSANTVHEMLFAAKIGQLSIELIYRAYEDSNRVFESLEEAGANL